VAIHGSQCPAKADDVPRGEHGGVLLAPVAVAEHLGLGREVGHERLRRAPGVALLPLGDGGVEQQQEHDPDEVLPVRRLAAPVCESDGHDRRRLHHPRERVPHEPEELENLALLHCTRAKIKINDSIRHCYTAEK